MERLHCNLNDLLEQQPTVPLEIKLRILHGIGLGVRYLHSRDPPIIHKDLTSKNVLLSDSIAVKIADLCTARLIPSNHYVQTTHSADFLPPNKEIGKEVDIFSFGCIMIHTFSHQWPTPLQVAVKSNDLNECCVVDDLSSELDRRLQYIDKVPKAVEDIVVPLITSRLENYPVDRPTAEELCDQLETLVVNRKSTLPDNLLEAQLVLQEAQQQIESQAAELYQIKSELCNKNTKLEKQSAEIEALRLKVSKMQASSLHHFDNLRVIILSPIQSIILTNLKICSNIYQKWFDISIITYCNGMSDKLGFVPKFKCLENVRLLATSCGLSCPDILPHRELSLAV